MKRFWSAGGDSGAPALPTRPVTDTRDPTDDATITGNAVCADSPLIIAFTLSSATAYNRVVCGVHF